VFDTPQLEIERLSTAERVADALREQLLSGHFAPGTPMRDGELSARAGVSRTTMREALVQLAREGLLAHSLHRGMEVAQLAAHDVRDIYALRRVLESAGAAALLADPATPIAAMEEAACAMAEAAAHRDRRGVVEADVAFHTAIAAALGNRRLGAAAASALKELRLVLSVTTRVDDDMDEQLREHRALLDLFCAGSPGAVRALGEHLAHGEEMVCAAMERAQSGSEASAER
jgi:DNA-binding GntR family transcriptional regulator